MIALLAVVALLATAAETGKGSHAWPQWGGPSRSFVTDAPALATSWPAEGPRRLWQRPLGDGYSAIVGEVTGRGSLLEDLQARGVTHLYVGGLATDYCVKHSVLDALGQGFAVTVLTDATTDLRFKPSDIVSRQRSRLSLMPEDLANTMTEQQMVDVLAFLATLRKEAKSASR